MIKRIDEVMGAIYGAIDMKGEEKVLREYAISILDECKESAKAYTDVLGNPCISKGSIEAIKKKIV